MKKKFFIIIAIAGALLLCSESSAEATLAVDRYNMKLQKLQEKAAEELTQYYEDGSNWYQCAILFRKIDRLQKKQQI